jgi:hypothetical protein
MEIAPDAPEPKRGDLIQTAIGTKRERTWFILRCVTMRRAKTRRFAIWKARWFELEPGMRMRLYRSAYRKGGQQVWHACPQKPKRKKPSFEDYMRREAREESEW